MYKSRDVIHSGKPARTGQPKIVHTPTVLLRISVVADPTALFTAAGPASWQPAGFLASWAGSTSL
jgi:hypothetical protein